MTTLANYSPSISPKSIFPGSNRHHTSSPASPFPRPQASPRSTPAQYRDVAYSGAGEAVSTLTATAATSTSFAVVGKTKRNRDFGTQYTPPGFPPTAGPALVGDGMNLSPRKAKERGVKQEEQKQEEQSQGQATGDLKGSNGKSKEKDAPQTPPAQTQAQLQSHVIASVTRDVGREGSSVSSTSLSSSSLVNGLPSSPKRSRADGQGIKYMPKEYKFCDVKDLGVLISDMLLELIRLNDRIPLQDGILTRFHSRAPPTISVHDYLNRLIIHTTLSPPLLLSTVYYIDRLCALYPAFTISSLTVHRFLITATTVAAKGLSDSFWTNHTYAKVGGVTTHELGMLELDFLNKLEWRIIPPAEILDDYYRSLVARMDGYELETKDRQDKEDMDAKSTVTAG